MHGDGRFSQRWSHIENIIGREGNDLDPGEICSLKHDVVRAMDSSFVNDTITII